MARLRFFAASDRNAGRRRFRLHIGPTSFRTNRRSISRRISWNTTLGHERQAVPAAAATRRSKPCVGRMRLTRAISRFGRFRAIRERNNWIRPRRRNCFAVRRLTELLMEKHDFCRAQRVSGQTGSSEPAAARRSCWNFWTAAMGRRCANCTDIDDALRKEMLEALRFF